ncbi:MAG: serine/threonine protein phosphatase PphA [Roseibaca calidilacus]|uniref:Serine/threonine protein phosphatase 1 n=1 Tax=Roseibaca calidilacus TaxID=1666912 RepID=A0A0P7Z1T7_9RHOB|nr:metallophosphoesterase [Roseibaca calidilacus]KPP95638.1 MAG: serine/threonine protein phosphatase PphA [Roseibaca calidilacus]CUX81964.1 serine/threonine protein phosphatase 1 [Roseibaca calidilacus]
MSLLSHLRRALGKSGNTASAECVEIPVLDLSEGPVYAVGDAHGCLSLYRQLEAQILRDAAALPGTPTVVLLGDIVDKGPDTAALLDFLLRPAPPPLRRLCLRGNHESMMLAYLEKPAKNAQWLGFGGVETLLSYGLALDADALQQMPERKLRQILTAHIPDTHLGFLHRTLPGLQVGQYLLAHAGADANAPLTAQPWGALLWGRAGLVAPDDLTLVYGHYVTAQPEFGPRAIGIDTGAYATGRLTCLRLTLDQPPAIMMTGEGSLFTDLP